MIFELTRKTRQRANKCPKRCILLYMLELYNFGGVNSPIPVTYLRELHRNRFLVETSKVAFIELQIEGWIELSHFAPRGTDDSIEYCEYGERFDDPQKVLTFIERATMSLEELDNLLD